MYTYSDELVRCKECTFEIKMTYVTVYTLNVSDQSTSSPNQLDGFNLTLQVQHTL
jgi:hypothetical protein